MCRFPNISSKFFIYGFTIAALMANEIKHEIKKSTNKTLFPPTAAVCCGKLGSKDKNLFSYNLCMCVCVRLRSPAAFGGKLRTL